MPDLSDAAKVKRIEDFRDFLMNGGSFDRMFAQALDNMLAGRPTYATPAPPTSELSITCPVCKMTSYDSNDVREGWCGYCVGYTTDRPGVKRTR